MASEAVSTAVGVQVAVRERPGALHACFVGHVPALCRLTHGFALELSRVCRTCAHAKTLTVGQALARSLTSFVQHE